MKTYYIEEKKMDIIYLRLRLLLLIDCDLKYQKINKLLNYLNNTGFIVDLSVFDCSGTKAEDYIEEKNVMSLTIDMINDKMRFKFFNGISTFWLYHLSDIFDALDFNRNMFSETYNKYEPITEILFNFKKRWKTSISQISYRYSDNDDVDLIYHIVFTQEVKDTKYAGKLINKIDKEIKMLEPKIIKDLNFRIEHSFEMSECMPCQKAKEEREKYDKRKDK